MAKTRETRFSPASRLGHLIVVGLFLAAWAPTALAQAAAEAASTTSLSSSAAANAKPMNMPKTLPSGDSGSVATSASGTSPHIIASANASAVETNRRNLEAKAGKDAARLLIRSYPSQAQVWIDEKPVGATPLLLIVPAGKYKIELRGTRQEIAKQEVALLPKETREVAVKLEPRYPMRVTAH